MGAFTCPGIRGLGKQLVGKMGGGKRGEESSKGIQGLKESSGIQNTSRIPRERAPGRVGPTLDKKYGIKVVV